MDLGLMVEGTLERDGNGRIVLLVQEVDGKTRILDVVDAVSKYLGMEVRLITTPLAAVAELARLVESWENE